MSSRLNILVTGKNGQLGKELQAIAFKYPQYKFLFTDRDTLDIGDKESVSTYFIKQSISFCINAAAYTAVDKAETEKDLALKVNAEAVKNLAEACKNCACKLIHISTDYVFDGLATEPYKEDQKTNPINFYGISKLMGEEAALYVDPSAIIIRTSWVYSFYGNNFVKTMLRLMSERTSINVVSDQLGSPTYAKDLAEGIVQIILASSTTLNTGGIYNYTNSGIISWFDFALAIKDLSGSNCSVVPISTSAYPTPAKRPTFSVLDKSKISQVFGLEIKEWKQSLEQCIAALREAKYF